MFEHALKQEDLHFSSFDNWQLRLTNIVFCFCFSFVFLFFVLNGMMWIWMINCLILKISFKT